MPNSEGNDAALAAYVRHHIEEALSIAMAEIQLATDTLPITGGGKPEAQRVLDVLDLMASAAENFFREKKNEIWNKNK